MIHFAWPWIFLLLPVPFVVLRLSQIRKQELVVIRAVTLPYLAPTQQADQRRNRLNKIILILCWLAFVGALARPQWLGEPIIQTAPSRDIMIALDTSKTMTLEDMAVNGKASSRLQATLTYLQSWLETRQGDRLGLILFGNHAAVDIPFTEDVRTYTRLLHDVEPGMIGDRTAIGEALVLAAQKMMNEPYEHKILILISDGIDTAQSIDPEQAAQLARKAGIKIYSIGVGADNYDTQSSNYFDDSQLEKIATISGGKYFRARSEQDLSDINQQIELLEPKVLENRSFQPYDDLFYWPALVMLIGIGVLLGRFRHD